MSKNIDKNDRKLTLIALIISVIALTICYLAYSNTIKIENSLKEESNIYDYHIGFSLVKDDLLQGFIEPYSIVSSSKNPDASTALLKGTRISNIKVNFYEANSYVVYKFYVYNASKEDLYLNDIIFDKISSTEKNKICTPINVENTESQIKNSCDYIKLGVFNYDYSTGVIYDSIYDINNVKIPKKHGSEINVIISYEKGAPKITIPFRIEFGDIHFKYSTYARKV